MGKNGLPMGLKRMVNGYGVNGVLFGVDKPMWSTYEWVSPLVEVPDSPGTRVQLTLEAHDPKLGPFSRFFNDLNISAAFIPGDPELQRYIASQWMVSEERDPSIEIGVCVSREAGHRDRSSYIMFGSYKGGEFTSGIIPFNTQPRAVRALEHLRDEGIPLPLRTYQTLDAFRDMLGNSRHTISRYSLDMNVPWEGKEFERYRGMVLRRLSESSNNIRRKNSLLSLFIAVILA